MFELETTLLVLLIITLLAAFGFEFVNGFHDTANAVATVIYTNSLPPVPAVVWSGFCNMMGVMLGGVGVAMGIVELLPPDLQIGLGAKEGVLMVMALLTSAILWNLGTWYYGIPCSSSHTLIGSIVGVGLAYSMLPNQAFGSGVNWGKAGEIGLSLLISPLIGFTLSALLLIITKKIIKNPDLYREPQKGKRPPTWIRVVLFLTCTGVSFAHGNNDGQKGVGLVMLILIFSLPTIYAINLESENYKKLPALVQTIEGGIKDAQVAIPPTQIAILNNSIANLKNLLVDNNKENTKLLRVEISNIVKALKSAKNQTTDLKVAGEQIQSTIHYSPFWVVLAISLCLGMGTMIGYKRIVVTIGEKIGKTHMTYSQGAAAELIAAGTIALSSAYSVPVSTTQVLSSGVAGTMLANDGKQNLQMGTIRSIFLAWVLTFPVTVVISGVCFFLYRFLFL
ncbi:MAG: anion permease [Cytophagales bacterium]|nr:MAG: anion permease [Cytophagales bacterium]